MPALAMSRARVNDQPGRLIDDDQIAILEQDRQSDRLGLEVERFNLRLHQHDAIARANGIAWTRGRLIQFNQPIPNQVLDS